MKVMVRRALVLLVLLAMTAPSTASTVIYRTDAELIALSERVVHARVLRQRTERPDAGGPIFTVSTLAVLEDLTGVPGSTVEVWELGGIHGNEGMFVGGAVEYTVGLEVLVCLERGRHGLRSVAMGFSKFDVMPAAGAAIGDGLLARSVAGVQTVGGQARGPERSLAEFRALAAEVRGVQPIRDAAAAAMLPDLQPRFTTLSSSNPRWFEADSGTPVVWYQNSNAPNPLTSGDAVSEIQTSLAAWTNPPTASLILQYNGTTSQSAPTGPWVGIPSNAGVISWEDPNGTISGSTLAVGGGAWFLNAGTINGVMYGRFARGYVMFNNAVELSLRYRQSQDFTRVLEHEIGHTIGLGHTDTTANPNPNIMFSSCCSTSTPIAPAIGPDDLLGLNTLYPSGSTPPPSCTFSISPASASPTAAGGTGTVTVTASASTCAWTAAVTTATFATITAGFSGTGSGTVSYSVGLNVSTSTRSGTLTIGGQTFTITQAASPAGCTYAIAPADLSQSGSAGTTPVSVTTAPGCPWAAVPVSSFITVASGSPATGGGSVWLAFTANTTGAVRIGTATIGGQTFTVTQAVPPSMAVNRPALNFGAVTTGAAFSSRTPAQSVRLTKTGTGTVTWTAASNVPWLTVTPASGSGSAALSVGIQFSATLPVPAANGSASAVGAITITYTGASSASSSISATLRLPGQSALPSGVVDTPAQGAAGLQGSFAVTGWALDDVGIDRVEIWRDLQPAETTPPFASTPSDPRNGKVFISNATFVEDARPDVEALTPTTPLNYRAGWGYLLLTWGLANQGNGTYTLHAFAFDHEGRIAAIGQKTIGVNNNAADRPFGSIDTPAIGGTASGTVVNFGWGLTPRVNGAATCTIQPAGVQVSIDSGPLQPVVYGDARTDIAGAFPGFSNTSAAGGHFVFDSTALANGAHTIGWLITDSCNRADGVGSRFFTVQNSSQTVAADAAAMTAGGTRQKAESADPLLVARGFGELSEQIHPNGDGERTVPMAPGERIELRLPRGFEAAYQLINGDRRPLPAGSTWDAASQVFSWQPGPGFLGEFQLVFAGASTQIRVLLLVRP